MSPILAGTLAGMMHVVSGPDHLVAVAPLAIRKPAQGLAVGTAWGLGHATGVLGLGLLGVMARPYINIKEVSTWSEVLVGGVLVGIGVWALRQSRNVVLHRHAHHHSQAPSSTHPHEHLHVHSAREVHTESAHRHHKRGAYAVGILHGAAGTGHLLGVLPALALSPRQGVAYLLAYAVAAVLAMAAFGAVMGSLGHRIRPIHLKRVMQGFGMVAIALGLLWVARGWPH